MFQRLLENPTINGIMCVPYSNLIHNDNTRQCCIDVLGNNISNEAVIVYSPSNNGIVVLGYYILNNLNMTESIYYQTLRDSTIRQMGFDPHQQISDSQCFKIEEWVFDESLNNKQYLMRIFSVIISSLDIQRGLTFLWCDNGFNEVVFYPINNDSHDFYPFAENYFSLMFCSNRNEQPNQ